MPDALAPIIAAARRLIDAVTFDDSGTAGRGGNGGLVSRDTIRCADELRLAIDAARSWQARVEDWRFACFRTPMTANQDKRCRRFLEEALELFQAFGRTEDDARELVDYVFGRPAGEPAQEVGGVLLTVAALCNAHGIDMDAAGEIELARVWTKIEQIRAKDAAKPQFGPLPGPTIDAPPATAEPTDAAIARAFAAGVRAGLEAAAAAAEGPVFWTRPDGTAQVRGTEDHNWEAAPPDCFGWGSPYGRARHEAAVAIRAIDPEELHP